MPIDAITLTLPFRTAPVLGELGPFSAAVVRIAAWLQARLATLRPAEAASRGVPAFRFEGLAITARIHPSQHGILVPPVRGVPVVGGFLSGFSHFIRGLARAGEGVAEEVIFFRFLGTLETILDAARASVERWRTPSASMFDVAAPRSAGDLLGQLVLAFRTLAHEPEPARVFIDGLSAWIALLRSGSGSGEGEGGSGAPGSLLDTVLQYVRAALYLVPLVPAWLAAEGRAYLLAAKGFILGELEAIERRVADVHRQVMDLFFVDLVGVGADAYAILLAAKIVAIDQLRFYFDFVLTALDQLSSPLRTFTRELAAFVNYWLSEATFNAIAGAILAHEVITLVVPVPRLGNPPFTLETYRITLGDVVDSIGGGGRLQAMLEGLATAFEVAAQFADSEVWINRARAVRELSHLLLAPITLPRETGLPPRAPRFPNFYREIFPAGRVATILDLLTFFNEARNGLGFALDDAAGMLDTFGARLERESRAVTRWAFPGAGTSGAAAAISGRADALTDAFLGGESELLAEGIAARPEDALALAFEEAFAGGGFRTLGAVIPRYLVELERFWAARLRERGAPSPTPTSPHILARRARLSRVVVPRMVLRARGRALDAPLAATVRERFRELVRRAYWTGEARLATPPALAPAAP